MSKTFEQVQKTIAILYVLLVLIMLFGLTTCARAEEYTDEEIAAAIWYSEGGKKAKVPYGILSVKVSGEKEARQVCLNTIRNQRKRHAKHTCGLDFLECLAHRYAPVNAPNDSQGLNSNWLSNMKYFLNRGAK